MTRDFSKQRRDDERPSSRNSSSGRYGEERSPRPARPRLNRETVDRAWENGAPQNHADYRGGRNYSNRNGQPPRDSRRRDSQFDQSSAQYSRNRPNSPGNYSSHNSSRPFGNHRQSQGAPYGNSNPRYQSTDYSVRDSRNSRDNDRRGPRYSDRPGETGPHRGFRDNPRYRDSGDQYHDRNADRRYGYQERDRDRDNRSPRNFDRSNRPYPPRGTPGHATQNPRSQSRPTMQRGNASSRRGQNFPRYRPQEEQFEGDYERFDPSVGTSAERSGAQNQRGEAERTSIPPSHPSPSDRPLAPQHPSTKGRFQENPSDRRGQMANEPPEHPVTRLPDGRVLKGPRPVQRKNAEFWNEIADETDALVDSVHTSPAEQPAHIPEATPAKQVKPKAAPKPSTPRTPRTSRKRPTSAVSRERKAGPRKAGTKKKIARARSTGPKPSQRGFKWPTP